MITYKTGRSIPTTSIVREAGTCTITQLEEIYWRLGKPDKFDILTMDAPYAEQMFEATLVNKRENLHKVIFEQSCAEDPQGLLDFIELILLWSPPKRMTAEEAIRHPFVSMYCIFYYALLNHVETVLVDKRMLIFVLQSSNFTDPTKIKRL